MIFFFYVNSDFLGETISFTGNGTLIAPGTINLAEHSTSGAEFGVDISINLQKFVFID